jgi:hypothetical protein
LDNRGESSVSCAPRAAASRREPWIGDSLDTPARSRRRAPFLLSVACGRSPGAAPTSAGLARPFDAPFVTVACIPRGQHSTHFDGEESTMADNPNPGRGQSRGNEGQKQTGQGRGGQGGGGQGGGQAGQGGGMRGGQQSGGDTGANRTEEEEERMRQQRSGGGDTRRTGQTGQTGTGQTGGTGGQQQRGGTSGGQGGQSGQSGQGGRRIE